MNGVYDPLDYDNLARSVVRALLETAPAELPPRDAFFGSGVYALYYRGDLPIYSQLADPESEMPIYVGKAVPKGGRKGRLKQTPAPNRELYQRLRQHARSIQQVNNLSLSEFHCRYLVVVPVWINSAERFLLEHFQPIWNTVIDGFGNHDPGKGRRNMRRPRWDIVHPGRPWAVKLKAAESVEQIVKQLVDVR